MVIITKTTLERYAKIHPLAAEPLNSWYKVTKEESWGCFGDVKRSFNTVDAVGNDRYCFNIKGNDFRLIVLMIFRARTVFILWFGSHVEYDRMNKKIGAANIDYNK